MALRMAAQTLRQSKKHVSSSQRGMCDTYECLGHPCVHSQAVEAKGAWITEIGIIQRSQQRMTGTTENSKKGI